jgi:cytochrome c peroxidase
MTRPSLLVPALALAVLGSACGGSGGGSADTQPLDVAALRAELRLAGVEPPPDPPAVSDELFALGRALFFDKVLSGNEDVSCATCHLPEFATGDGRTLSDGVHGIGLGPMRGGGAMIPRNSPALLDVHAKRELFWDGHVRKVGDLVFVPPTVGLTAELRTAFSPGLELLAAQAMLPAVSRDEMRGTQGENELGDLGDGYDTAGGRPESTHAVWVALTERLLDLPGYVQLLTAAYPGVEVQDFTFAHAGNAIAAFEARAFARGDSPFERFVRGDDAALSTGEVRGALAFYRAGCASCHSGGLLTDEEFHNTGMPQLGPGVDSSPFSMFPGWDIGRANTTGRPDERFAFRTPSLLNVALTAPYGHAGQFAELSDMVAHYEDPERSNRQYDVHSNVIDPVLVHMVTPNNDEVLATLSPLVGVVDLDVDAIVEFLGALTGRHAADLSDVVPAAVPSGLPIF